MPSLGVVSIKRSFTYYVNDNMESLETTSRELKKPGVLCRFLILKLFPIEFIKFYTKRNLI